MRTPLEMLAANSQQQCCRARSAGALQRWRREGTVEPERYGGWKRSALAAHAERVHDLLREEPDLTIAALRRRLAAAAIDVSPAAISRFLAAVGLTRKKRPGTRPNRNGRTSPRRGPSGATDRRR
jgi:transposase